MKRVSPSEESIATDRKPAPSVSWTRPHTAPGFHFFISTSFPSASSNIPHQHVNKNKHFTFKQHRVQIFKASFYLPPTYLQLPLDPSFASFPKGHLGLVVLGHDLHELPGQNRVLRTRQNKRSEVEDERGSVPKTLRLWGWNQQQTFTGIRRYQHIY